MNSARDLILEAQEQLAKQRVTGLWTKVVKVFIPTRMMAVNARGYHGPRKVEVIPDINLGTVFIPLVSAGDEAYVEKDRSGKWWATKIRVLVKCDPVTPPTVPNIPLPQIDLPLIPDFRSFTPFIQELQPFNPNFMAAGILSPIGGQALSGVTYDVGGGYVGTIPAGTIAQPIGLVNAATWTKYFVAMTGSDSWTMVLNGTTIASGSGSASGTLTGSPIAFAGGSKFVFNLTAGGSASDLFWGAGA